MESLNSSISSRLSNADVLEVNASAVASSASTATLPSPVFPAAAITMPKSRHSIDLGASSVAATNQLLGRTIHIPYPSNIVNYPTTTAASTTAAAVATKNGIIALQSPR